MSVDSSFTMPTLNTAEASKTVTSLNTGFQETVNKSIELYKTLSQQLGEFNLCLSTHKLATSSSVFDASDCDYATSNKEALEALGPQLKKSIETNKAAIASLNELSGKIQEIYDHFNKHIANNNKYLAKDLIVTEGEKTLATEVNFMNVSTTGIKFKLDLVRDHSTLHDTQVKLAEAALLQFDKIENPDNYSASAYFSAAWSAVAGGAGGAGK